MKMDKNFQIHGPPPVWQILDSPLMYLFHDFICNTQIQRYPSGLWYSTEYSTFSISDEDSKYVLTVAGYSGDAGDATAGQPNPFHLSNGRMFTMYVRQ